jgi:hypothetical protein
MRPNPLCPWRVALLATIIGVVGLLLAALAAWYTRAALYPGRELTLYVLPPASVISGDARSLVDNLGGVDIGGGRVVADPYVVAITLEATGRSDVPSSAFDGDRPLSLDVGTAIVDVLQSDDLLVTLDATRVRIGPELLKRGRRWNLQLLTDGPPDLSRLPDRVVDPFVDVRLTLRQGAEPSNTPPGSRGRVLSWATAAVTTAAAVATAVSLVFAFYQSSHHSTVSYVNHGGAGSMLKLEG